MDPELKTIFTESRCLNEKEMLSYLAGELSDTERRQVELHLAGCPLCTEALEGLSQVQPSEAIPGMVRQVKDRISVHLRRRAGKRKAQKFYILLCLTVFVVLVIVLVAYLSFRYTTRAVHPGHPARQESPAPTP